MIDERERTIPLVPGFDISMQDAVNLGWLSTQLAQGNLVVFIGAGVSRNAVRSGGSRGKVSSYPLWKDLIRRLIESIADRTIGRQVGGQEGFSFNDDIKTWPFPKVAGVFSSRFGRNRLISEIEEMLDTRSFYPGPVHKALVQMRWADIITTNYDDFIERAFMENGIRPHVISEDSMIRADLRKPWIVKMNGCLTGGDRNRIVIDDEDFRRYSRDRPLIELFVKRSFVENYVLFIGFSMDDPAFQNIFGWIRDNLKGREIHVYSIQWDVSDAERAFWQAKMISVIELHSSNVACRGCDETGVFCDKETVYGERLLKVLNAMRERANEMRTGRETESARRRTGIKLFVRLNALISAAAQAESTGEFLEASKKCSDLEQLNATRGVSAYFDNLVRDSRCTFQGSGDESFLIRLAVEVAKGKWWKLMPEVKRYAMNLTSIVDTSDETLGFYLLDDFFKFEALDDPYRRERWERLLPKEYDCRRARGVRTRLAVTVREGLIFRVVRDLLDMVCAGRVPVGESVRERVSDLLYMLTRLAEGPKPRAEDQKTWSILRQRVSLALIVACALAGDLLWKTDMRAAMRTLCRWGLVDQTVILRWLLFRLIPGQGGAACYRFVAPDVDVAAAECEGVTRSQSEQQRRGCCAWLWMQGAMAIMRSFLCMLEDQQIADAARVVELVVSGVDSQDQFGKWSRVAAWLSHQGVAGGHGGVDLSSEALASLDRTLFDRALRLQHIPPLSLSERRSPAPDDFEDELFDRLLRHALRRPGTDLAKDVLRWVWYSAGHAAVYMRLSQRRMERIESWTENLLRQPDFFDGASWISEIRLLYESGFAERVSDDLKTAIHDAAIAMIREVSRKAPRKTTWYGEYHQHYRLWVRRLQLIVEELGWSRIGPVVQGTIISEAPSPKDAQREKSEYFGRQLDVEEELDARIDLTLVACSGEDELTQEAVRVVAELVKRGGVGEVRSPLSRMGSDDPLADQLLDNVMQRWRSTSRVSMVRAVRSTSSVLRHLAPERAAEVDSPFLSALFHKNDDVIQEVLRSAAELLPSPWWATSGPRFLANLKCRFDTDSPQCARSIALFLQELPAGDESTALIDTFVDRVQFAEARRLARGKKSVCRYPRL